MRLANACTLCTQSDLCSVFKYRTRSSSVVTLARPSVSSSLEITNRSFRYASPQLWNQLPSSFRQPHCVHSPPGSPHPTYISPHHSHHLRSHHLSLPPPFFPDLKLISFTNPFLHSHSYSFRTDFTDLNDLNLYCINGALALFVLVSFSGYVCYIKLNTQLSSPR